MELDCTIWDDVTFVSVDDKKDVLFPIKVLRKDGISVTLTKYGQFTSVIFSKCVIFPKGKTTWEGFQIPFKDGDVVVSDRGDIHLLRTLNSSYCAFRVSWGNKLDRFITTGVHVVRLATEEEKQKLFKAIKDNGYKWNTETKTLEKLIEPKFKVGDRVKHISAHTPGIVVKVDDKGYYIDYPKGNGVYYISFTLEKDYELLPAKFDITTLKPFSKVLVRQNVYGKWGIDFFGYYNKGNHRTTGSCVYKQCVPYEGNEHLLGTTDDCDEYFKTWKSS